VRASVVVSLLVAAPVWAAVEVTQVTFAGQLDPALAGVSTITVDGASIPVAANRTFEANIPVPTGAAVEVMENAGSVINPLISPDGTRVVYSSGFATGSKSIFVRDLAVNSTPVWVGSGDIGFWSASVGGDQIVYSDWSAKNKNGSARTYVFDVKSVPAGSGAASRTRIFVRVGEGQ
jgi:Tol biopolymer transport system component